jgi:hypothetical protein
LALLLYINKHLVDLDSNQVIAQTKQVNDLNSLDNRQASYTNKFRLPKTANNIRIMGFLTLAGNNSEIPYQKNECSLYSDNGECFVYNGWAVVTDGGDSFDAVVYDGIIDLYKAIENKNIAAVNLEPLEHTKGLTAVMDTWNPNDELYGKCRYILADYNGKTGYAPSLLGMPQRAAIDYLVPSVNVAWLWDRVFSMYGIGYSGSVFHTQQFKNLWMTYPKGLTTQDEGTEVFTCDSFTNATAPYDGFPKYWRTYLFKYNPEDTAYLDYFVEHPQRYRLTAKESGYYRIDLKCNIRSYDNVRLFVVKNVSSTGNSYLDSLPEHKYFSQDLPKNTDFEGSVVVHLEENESVSLLMRHHNGVNGRVILNNGSSMETTITKLNLAEIDFSEAFADFSIKDFLSEVIYRFGLTLFKDKYADSYEFLTLQEVLQSPDPADLSRKFVKKLSENYIYGTYAQNNWFRYSYNEKENNHNDAYVSVQNVNLPESKDIIKSKVYSPEKEKSRYLRRSGNIYKLWEKEIDDDPEAEVPVTYKPLDKRYYFLRSEAVDKTIRLRFDATNESATMSSYWVENYWKLSFTDSIADYYSTLGCLLNKTQLVTTELYLTDSDIANFDFRKLYYIEQLGGYFLMNKISNYVPGKPVKCELLRIAAYSPDTVARETITMTKVVTGNFFVDVYFTAAAIPAAIALNVTKANGDPMPGRMIDPLVTRLRYAFTVAGVYNISLTADGYTTPPVQVNIPNNSTILLP